MNPKQFTGKVIQKVTTRVRSALEERKYRRIASNYALNGYKRIYLVHIRKTGGTSLNHMFLSLSGEDPDSLYAQLVKTPSNRICTNGLIYVGWDSRCINQGNYFYGFSHIPLHKLALPKNTLTVSCFRDPVERVVSHYNMLLDFRVNNIDHPCMAIEGKWLGESFDDFSHRIPKEHLLNQLYMFSSSFNINEAVRKVQGLSHYFFTDTFEEGIHELSKKAGLNLEPIHIRKASYHVTISENSLTRLRDMLDDEYKFLGGIRESQIA